MEDWVPLFQTGLWVVIVAVILLILRPDVRLLRDTLATRLAAGSTVKMGPIELGELRRDIASVKADVGDINARITNLFLLTMSVPMFTNLRKISSGALGPFEKSTALDRELRHLRDLGYIEIDSIGDLPSSGEDLSRYVRITQPGQLFVELRRQVQDVSAAAASMPAPHQP